MLNIDRLSLRLPPGFEHRGGEIVQLLGEALAARRVSASVSLERLEIPPLTVDPAASNAAIAEQIAGAIHAGLTDHQNGGGSVSPPAPWKMSE
ncbi:MAG: hypothetical protein SVU69_11760 [Pseudomonadota bacterium]|nr:hypothetical protein [Pseudomonadota bacterium]